MIQEPAITVPEVQPRSVASIVLAVISIGLCVNVEGAFLVSRHPFSRLFDDFQVEMSVVTRFAISPFFPVLLAIVILAAVLKEFVPAFRPFLDKCNWIVLLIGASCLAVYVVGVFAPLMSLTNSLSS